MSFIWNFMSKAKISEDMLKKNDIPILDISKLEFDNQNETAITSSGKFYQGKYENKNISLKIIDITIDEQAIMEEFTLWKNDTIFLKLKGVILYYNNAYIIFQDSFEGTIQTLLGENKLKYDEKIIIAKQILNILKTLIQEKKTITDLRTGTFIINSEKKVKLIDLGKLVNRQNYIHEEEIKNMKIRYTPPEYLIQNEIDESYDIYSFGCILIDLFAKDLNETIFIDKNKTYEDYLSDIKENKLPSFPNNINCLLHDIILRCLINDPKKRIKINELAYNLNILLDYLKEVNSNMPLNIDNINDNEIKNNDIIENENTKKYKEIYNFAKNLNKEAVEACNRINSELQSKILNMKNNLLNEYDNALKELEINHKLIKTKLDDIINSNRKLIESFYQKIMKNIHEMQNLLSTGLNDLLDIQIQVKGIQYDIYNFNKFINQEKYENVLHNIETSKIEVNKATKKYSNNKNFDLIDISCESCSNLVKNYIDLTQEFTSDIKNVVKDLNNIKGINNNNKKLEELGDEFFIQKIINNIVIPKNEIQIDIHEKEIEKDKIVNEKEGKEEEEKEEEEIEGE